MILAIIIKIFRIIFRYKIFITINPKINKYLNFKNKYIMLTNLVKIYLIQFLITYNKPFYKII